MASRISYKARSACGLETEATGGPGYVEGWASHPIRERNYALFAALAGVRGPGPAPLGVPDDASDMARMAVEEWGGDGHSHSWLTLEAAVGVLARHGQILSSASVTTTALKSSLDDALAVIRTRILGPYSTEDPDEVSRFRLVFWFDN